MNIFLKFCAVLCLGSFTVQAIAQERGEIPAYAHYGSANAESIDSFVIQYQSAWRELDAERFANLHSQDTEWINAFARIFRGRVALKAFAKERLFPLFAQMQNDIDSLVLHTISTRLISDSAAVVHAYTDFGAAATENPRRVHFHLVLSQNQGQWEIVHTAIMDPRQ